LKKVYIIDTNVILEDPNSVRGLDGEILIPTTVLKELDVKKYGDAEKNRNAREFGRIIDKNQVVMSFPISHNFPGENDEQIIELAIQKRKDGNEVILITNDFYMSFLAKAYGLTTQKSVKRAYVSDDAYTGLAHGDVDDLLKELAPPHPNKYYISKSGIFKHVAENNLVRLPKDKRVWGIKHKNAEQKCALDALLDESIKLVTISGRAGTGKTLLAIAAGLEMTISENKYQKLLVSRPVVPMGNDIGFLPGDINEKLGPWMQPIFDNIDFLFNNSGKKSSETWLELEKEGLLKIEALTYIRGRSIPHQYMIIDEAQNLSKHEIKTIITRAGEGTKIILTGDPDQIDNPKLDSTNNGLSYVIAKFKDQRIAAHITLTKCERSELADIAAEIL